MTDNNLIVVGSSVSSSLRDALQNLDGQDGFELMNASIANFGSGEPFSELFFEQDDQYDSNKNKLKDANVIIAQSTADPVGDNCMQLMMATATAKRYGAKSVTVVMPFAAFARQDREFEGRFASVAGDDFPMLLKAAGADQVITAEMHSKAAEQYYKNHFGEDNVHFLSTASVVTEQLIAGGIEKDKIAVGAPDGADKPHDAGQLRAVEVANKVSDTHIPEKGLLFRIWKEHTGVSQTKINKFEGDVKGKTCVIIDDMTDSGGTLKNAAKVLKANGAKEVICYITHGIFTGNGMESIVTERTSNGDNAIDKLIVADTIPDVERKLRILERQYPNIDERIEIASTAELIISKIQELHNTNNANTPKTTLKSGPQKPGQK